MLDVRHTTRSVALAIGAFMASPTFAEAPPEADASVPPSAEERPSRDLAQPALPRFLEEIEVKGRRAPRLDTLEAREVRETAARDLGESLDAQANVSKVRKAGIANDVVLRGMKKDDVNVLIDGAKVHGACPSRMDPPAFHLDYAEVDRVEVKRGPFDVRNPGGLGGLIDVRTRRTHPALGVELNAEYGSFGASQSSGVVAWGHPLGDAQVGAAYKYSEPFASGDGRNFTLAIPATRGGRPNAARFRNTSDSQQAYAVASGWGKVGLVPAEDHRLELAYTRQSATDVLYPYLLMDGIADTTDRVNATYRIGGAAAPQALAQLYWSRVAHDMDDRDRCSSSASPDACAGALPRTYSMRTEARATVLGGKLEAATYGALELLGGGDFYLRNWNNTTSRVARLAAGQPYGVEASVPDVDILDVGLYAQARKELADDLHVTAGFRLDLATTDARTDRTALYQTFFPAGDVARSRTDVLASGNVQADLRVLEAATVFAGYGHGNRVPDPQERYYALTGMAGNPAYVGFPALRPMQSDELDLGAKWGGGGVVAKVQVFHAWLHDDIVLTNASAPAAGGAVQTAKTYGNVEARTYGGEASARVALPAHLFVSGGASYTRGLNVTRGGDLAEMPPFKLVAALRYDVNAFFAEAEEVYAARQDRVDVALQEQPTAAWFITNVRVGVAYKGLRAFAGVRNLLDKFYYEHLAYLRDPFASGTKVPEPGRSFYGTLQYAF